MSAALIASTGLNAAESDASGRRLLAHPTSVSIRATNPGWRRMCIVIRLAWNSVLAWTRARPA
jgi:hypothetical protein